MIQKIRSIEFYSYPTSIHVSFHTTSKGTPLILAQAAAVLAGVLCVFHPCTCCVPLVLLDSSLSFSVIHVTHLLAPTPYAACHAPCTSIVGCSGAVYSTCSQDGGYVILLANEVLQDLFHSKTIYQPLCCFASSRSAIRCLLLLHTEAPWRLRGSRLLASFSSTAMYVPTSYILTPYPDTLCAS